uniref:Dynein regulatory complex protein 10 n=1 Tax=Polytomella parva TaxID=51329 RepID=A0A7S0VE46_9CHLO|mmetsp:Transcript_30507/g.55661  ORF Transcript_30507/g.55661 Transcript_30507/m.55661 type:complete len:356 (+) Transcript_30507:118-1185(+)|eukprot:CAMPEP_0175074634 /NCGR_PEP_ID=MMETSP0052_2-20121109/21441_1 /TAXON_ID=51329 ORGANISM="Polytomella parva, Strain SAG 63-3" /NCGR_SAMPLE_ID=MMETSP0052_2 /ASSEMBLY_ACC=CAM_ASM_000194 /LENGTH=355 /DNA_ID=CAMNT_0016343005 /DNA_START=30 /DNA_END=1097 /DNA_ORIENTATION=-
MNSLEASRVLAVLDETYESIKLISYITGDVLETAEQLRDILGQDLTTCFIKHRELSSQLKGHFGNAVLNASTLELCRLLKKSTTAHRLQSLPYERTYGMLQCLDYFQKLRQFAAQRLTTTVEEDSSRRDYFEEVKEREERAVAERLQLEQKLRLQRAELHKATSTMQSNEDRVRGELHEVSSSAQRLSNETQSGAARQLTEDTATYETELESLTKSLNAAKAELDRIQADHMETEQQLRKARKRSQLDIETQVNEYDTDVGAKEDELQQVKSEYDELVRELADLNKSMAEMRTERLEYEERRKRMEMERHKAALELFTRKRAARVIQRAFRAHKAKNAAAKKKGKKGASGKKGKK